MSERSHVLSRLQELGIPYELHDHEEARSMEDCLNLPFLDSDTVFLKNILLTTRQKDQWFLYLTLPDKPYRTADVSKKLETSRLSFAPPEVLPEMLHLESGSLSPLGLWFDEQKAITLVLDRDIYAFSRVAVHPCDNHSTLIFSMDAFRHQVIPSLHHITVDLSVPWPGK